MGIVEVINGGMEQAGSYADEEASCGVAGGTTDIEALHGSSKEGENVVGDAVETERQKIRRGPPTAC